MARPDRGAARQTGAAGACRAGPERRTNAPGLRARRWYLGRGPGAGPALACGHTAPEHRQRWHCFLNPFKEEFMSNVHVINHPLVQHKLTLMRRKDASTNTFRRLLNELSSLMAYEVTRDMAMQEIEIETPLETMTAKVIDGKKLVFVSILRAGTG